MRKALIALVVLAVFFAFQSGNLPAQAPAGPDGQVVEPVPPPAEVPHGEEDHGEGGGHGGPVVPVLLGLVIVLAAAKLGGELFERVGQPAVLGELIFGMILGNLTLAGFGWF